MLASYHGKVLICNYCNAPIKAVDIFEKVKSLLDVPISKESKTKPTQPPSFCSSCGAQLNSEDVFCSHCGKKIT
ncbi:MAG: zinc ribbon domain-containing protein [Candidatus Bathyarchaeota archaeon]|nr:MAG: zinc ribbon domain-containing protein [Candidatus Bathyarchaeota archaeon]